MARDYGPVRITATGRGSVAEASRKCPKRPDQAPALCMAKLCLLKWTKTPKMDNSCKPRHLSRHARGTAVVLLTASPPTPASYPRSPRRWPALAASVAGRGHVGWFDPLMLGKFGDGGLSDRLKHPFPADQAGQKVGSVPLRHRSFVTIAASRTMASPENAAGRQSAFSNDGLVRLLPVALSQRVTALPSQSRLCTDIFQREAG